MEGEQNRRPCVVVAGASGYVGRAFSARLTQARIENLDLILADDFARAAAGSSTA